MKYTLIIISFLLSLPIIAQQKIGIGILSVKLEDPVVLNLYSNPEIGAVTKKIEILKNKTQDLILNNSDQTLKWFVPEGFWLDYYIFNFRVVTKLNNWYEIIVNQKTGKTLWLQDNSFLKFFNWNEFLENNVTSISANNVKVEIKSEPDENSKTLRNLEKTDCMEIIKVKGDWIQVKSHTILDCDESEKPLNAGWIKWKENNQLTIEYGLTC